MAPIELFQKTATMTDVSKGLNFPIKKLHHLPAFQNGRRKVHLLIEAGPVYPVGCTISPQQDNKKPVFSDGWRKVVRDLGLEVGDEMTFFKLGEGHLMLQVTKANEVRQHDDHELEKNDATLKNDRKEEKNEINCEDGKTSKKIKLFGVFLSDSPVTLSGVVTGSAAA